MDIKLKRITILCILTLMVFYTLSKSKPEIITKTIQLTPKTEIIENAQFKITPTLTINGEQKLLNLSYTIISYQNPEVVNLNYKNQSLLEINKKEININEYNIIHVDDYTLKTNIEYDVSNIKQIDNI